MTERGRAARDAAIAVPAHLADAGAGLIADLVNANRILYRQGVVDAFGHVSARHRCAPGISCWRAIWHRRWSPPPT